MDLDPATLGDKSKREIVRELIDYVVTTESEFEKKENRSGDRTDLNIYLADNQGYTIGDLDEWIHRLTDGISTSGYAQNYAQQHTFNEEVADEDIALITITTPTKNREDEFIFVTTDGYLWVLTTISHDWREKTIENLLKYLPCIERLYLSSDDLENLTGRIDDSRVSGFTAEYNSAYRNRNATLQFSGAEPEDLEKAELYFDAKPTRIEFDQRNSPTTAIQGASTNEGRVTVRSVIRGSETKAVQTLLGLTEDYQSLDQQSFQVEHRPQIESFKSGLAVEGFTAIELTNPDRDEAELDEFRSELEDYVLNANRYRYTTKDSGRKFRVYDTEYDELFDIALEPPDIILYARTSTTALSLRSIVREVYNELDSTYALRKLQSSIVSEGPSQSA